MRNETRDRVTTSDETRDKVTMLVQEKKETRQVHDDSSR